jgi:predicted lactoylglutathione lyase
MGTVDAITIEAADAAAAQAFYAAAFGDDRIRVQASDAPTDGFRGFVMSVLVAEPATANGFIDSAAAAGATVLKPAAKSMWGYGGVVQAPDGTIWTIASSSKKDTGPATRDIDGLVVQLGCDDVAASKQFYVDHGVALGKSFGSRYVELATGSVAVTLNKRAGIAKNAGVSDAGSGSHRLVLNGDLGALTDPDGFAWA